MTFTIQADACQSVTSKAKVFLKLKQFVINMTSQHTKKTGIQLVFV